MEEDFSKISLNEKQSKGQFYTTNASYILDGFTIPLNDIRCIIEPFAGKGDLLKWIYENSADTKIEAFDIMPKHKDVLKQDTLLQPPNYQNGWIITNPPYLARNKSKDKTLYDLYYTNDLYKCFIKSVVKQNNCKGGIFIIPAGFFFSHRDIDISCRNEFMTKFKIKKIKYFEEKVFDDTSTTIVAFAFEKAEIEQSVQNVEWIRMPSKETKVFTMSAENDWIIGGDIYKLPTAKDVIVRRHVENKKLKDGEQQTFITLNALDSGKQNGRISLTYTKDVIYPAKECSRTYATLRIFGKTLSEAEQIQLCSDFNTFLEKKRYETWSLFLPQFRESKEYARKRIPFDLAYNIILYLIEQRNKTI
jgi:hypothetical protein